MSGSQTPTLGLEYLDPSQAQPEVKINAAWNLIDAAVGDGQGIAVSNSTASPAIVARATELQFEGSGVTVEHETGGKAIIIIPGATSSDSGGSPVAVTDATHTVENVTAIRFTSGATVSEASDGVADVYIAPVSGGGADGGVPSTISDLVFWFQGDEANVGSGNGIHALGNSCPWYRGLNAYPLNGPGITRSATQLNGKNVFTFPVSSAGRYQFAAGLALTSATFFLVINPNLSGSNPGWEISGPSGALEFAQDTSAAKVALVKDSVAVIGTSTGALTNGSWYQINASYDGGTGDYSFRIGQMASGSGTNSQTISANTTVIGYNSGTGAADSDGSFAEIIIYNRALTLSEIEEIEGYLNSKWGV